MLAFAWIGVQDAVGLFLFSIVYGSFAGAITTVTTVVVAVLSPTLAEVRARIGMLLLP